MKTKREYDFHVDELIDFDWIFAPESGGEDGFPVRENIQKAAELYKVSPEFLQEVDETFRFVVNEIIENFKKDLKDLYELTRAEDKK